MAVPIVYSVAMMIMLVTCCTLAYNKPDISHEICGAETLIARCPRHHLILTTTARYGRMRLGKCAPVFLGHIGCSADVLGKVDKRCSGRRRCEIRIPDADLQTSKHNCLVGLTVYLEITYTCIQVRRISKNDLHGVCTVDHIVDIAPTPRVSYAPSLEKTPPSPGKPLTYSGYLAPVEVTRRCPHISRDRWTFSLRPGMYVNLTVYDLFGVTSVGGGANSGLDTTTWSLDHAPRQLCHIRYGGLELEYEGDEAGVVTTKKGAGRNAGVAGRGCARLRGSVIADVEEPRKLHASLRDARIVTLQLRREPGFIIHYQVYGCSDPNPPEHGWTRRTGKYSSNAELGCIYSTRSKWSLACKRGIWYGATGNCSAVIAIVSRNPEVPRISTGIAVLVILLAAFGVGCCVVIIGLKFNRRSHHDPRRMRTETTAAVDMQLRSTSCGLHNGDDVDSDNDTDKCRRQKTIRIDGNDYQHIWEAPLPSPVNSLRSCTPQRGQLIYNPDAHARYADHTPKVTNHAPTSSEDARNRILNIQCRGLDTSQDGVGYVVQDGAEIENRSDAGVLELTAVKLLDDEGSCQQRTPTAKPSEPHYVTPKHAKCLSGIETLVQIS